MGYLAPGKMFHNMLQLMHFSVYFEGVLYTNVGIIHKNNDISGTHARGLWACSPQENFENLVSFDVSLHTIL